ncbi:hypothetical protein F2Q69_00017484 [Brassica cretica]|uniref:Uncharacterized protein n=1 Tax=Brassica cretica TaxID=69181 RepID=A0A8S9R9P5_BRACR|nr:hypothetical protein F2Q69_00017484 [Brassica cretica]
MKNPARKTEEREPPSQIQPPPSPKNHSRNRRRQASAPMTDKRGSDSALAVL